MRSKSYVVYGNPIPLARCRYSGVRVYDSQKNLKLIWGIGLQKQHNDEEMFIGPLQLELFFYFPIAKKGVSHNKIQSLKSTWHFKRPDLSNLLKFVEDVATGIIYEDDCIISEVLVKKFYDDGNGPRTEFTIRELK
jgi:Holliday junction resolvase RusA-like endonuclease